MADKMLRCGTCAHYINPRVRRNYPNTDNEAVGWVTCGIGSTIKRMSMACPYHPDQPDPATEPSEDDSPVEPQKRRLII